jgi:copper chaperone CopZ
MAHVTAAVITVTNVAQRRPERAIGEALAGLAGVWRVGVDAASHQVEVAYDEAMIPIERIQEALTKEGYAVARVVLRLRRQGAPSRPGGARVGDREPGQGSGAERGG